MYLHNTIKHILLKAVIVIITTKTKIEKTELTNIFKNLLFYHKRYLYISLFRIDTNKDFQ
jgi:hypothetical protein